ncbi:MAG TPA: SRPBCC family protein [Chloroflexota bacterium]|nr:SRPBCC family protein [Chloroflexota bacterium]
MSLSLRASVDIRAPAERIFDLVCTPERLPEWNVSIASARRGVAGEAVCLGSRAVLSGRLLGQTLESETEVVSFEPPRLFATRAIRGPRLQTRFVLASLPAGTRVEIDVSGEVPGGALGAKLAEGFLRKELTASLERLRAMSEQSS